MASRSRSTSALSADGGRGWQCRLAGVGAAEELLRAEGVEKIVTGAGGGAEGVCAGESWGRHAVWVKNELGEL